VKITRLGHVAFGLLNRAFALRGEFQLVFNHVVQPFAYPTKFRLRKLPQFGFHLLQFAHGHMIESIFINFKSDPKF
jgi:hypothetical protein